LERVKDRMREFSRRGQDWVERQEPDSASGVAIGAWRRYRAVDGPLQSALLGLGAEAVDRLSQHRRLRRRPCSALRVAPPRPAAVHFHPRSTFVKALVGLGWTAFLMLFFALAPWLLTHRQLTLRDFLPGAALTAVALVVLMVVSRFVMQYWVDLYARDYGGLGVVLAIYFWIAFSSAIIVWTASLSPALAERRSVRASGADATAAGP
jgi:hypothetical protein